ncbi:MAG: sigma 54-interacting transcriptional regulator [Terriglobia bacterium]
MKPSSGGKVESGPEFFHPARFKIILDSINDGVFTVDKDFLITSFNRAAEIITGVKQREAVGRPCWEVLKAEICEGECALKETMRFARPVVNKPVQIISAQGLRVPISVSTAVLKNERGNIIGGVETFRDLSAEEELRKEAEHKYSFHEMLSKNSRMQGIFELLPQIAQSDCNVLLTGESGTGKELLATALHNLSQRSSRPLVTLNCGALPESLLESELFGYKAGAFTGALSDKPGRLSAAQGGTLFLDEIGDISPAIQVKFLRVLQERVFEPLGSNEPMHTDARFIAATHKDLKNEVREGRFREDLYYRLDVVQIALPPLKERREDIPLLIQHFISKLNRRYRRNIQTPDSEALRCLMTYEWAGNIRELQNALEHAFVLCRRDIICLEDLPSSIRKGKAKAWKKDSANLREMEASLIQEALRRNNGNRAAAARELGVHKTTLWRKLKQLRPTKDA